MKWLSTVPRSCSISFSQPWEIRHGRGHVVLPLRKVQSSQARLERPGTEAGPWDPSPDTDGLSVTASRPISSYRSEARRNMNKDQPLMDRQMQSVHVCVVKMYAGKIDGPRVSLRSG
ncbi:hypothetical protein DPEC_G00328100 [Dallia pectoralis]|uniref:Uncharacterized protein n=1 Tax=Dallia pectoralis TaxID=75939 RepID=A0ACC2F8A3_DALPE|nr:hypothetical protein DPEC_G00328100 [Dallia pectoralis]